MPELGGVTLPDDVREKLAELDLELSEGKEDDRLEMIIDDVNALSLPLL